MAFLKRINIFTILLVVVCLSFALRLSHLVTGEEAESNGLAVTLQKAEAVEEVDEEPPEMDVAQADKADKKVPLNLSAEDLKSVTPKDEPEKPLQTMPKIYSQSEIEVLKSLSKRRDELDQRDRRLSQRQALLDAAEKQVDQKIVELKTLRDEIENLLVKQHGMQEDQLKSLVKIYETMKPKDAARIFDTLEMDVLLEMLSRMSERKMAPIFAAMDAARAQEVTIRLAEQRRLPELPEDQE